MKKQKLNKSIGPPYLKSIQSAPNNTLFVVVSQHTFPEIVI